MKHAAVPDHLRLVPPPSSETPHLEAPATAERAVVHAREKVANLPIYCEDDSLEDKLGYDK